MLEVFDALRQMTPESVLFRLALAMLFGGMIGMERGRKGRAAGFRTYMLVCLGSALTMLLGQYEYEMLSSSWAAIAEEVGPRIDVGRFGAQVINGIGFLGAGTIIVTGRQEVKGMTTAACLWASACTGLAIGAGFYECVLLAFLLIPLVTRALPYVESYIVENARNMNIYVEFRSLDDVGDIINRLKMQDVQIYDVRISGDGRRGRPAPYLRSGCGKSSPMRTCWRRSPSWRRSASSMRSDRRGRHAFGF